MAKFPRSVLTFYFSLSLLPSCFAFLDLCCFFCWGFTCSRLQYGGEMFLRKLRKHFWRNFPVHLSFCFQDMRNLRFAHKQENHSRRIVYDKLMVMNTFTNECRLLFLNAYPYKLFFLWLRMEVILFISSTCMYMLQYFLFFVQLTL